MTDTSRNQGALICIGAAVAALLFVLGVLRGSYLALAIPVAILTLFALGLVFWVGWTIYTVQVEPERDEPPATPTVPPSPPSSTSASR
jgi:branched-subunit amino acid ABC-type transport system permease component